jgi:hypothetical protein
LGQVNPRVMAIDAQILVAFVDVWKTGVYSALVENNLIKVAGDAVGDLVGDADGLGLLYPLW